MVKLVKMLDKVEKPSLRTIEKGKRSIKWVVYVVTVEPIFNSNWISIPCQHQSFSLCLAWLQYEGKSNILS